MKDWLSIKAIPRLLFIKKSYVFIAYKGIDGEKKSQFWDMLFFERLWHLRLKWFEILNYVIDFIIAYCV
jgi:hypothetical protein